MIGLFTGLGRISQVKIVNQIATVYVEVIRGIPLLVQLFYIYYALARFVKLPDIASAVIASRSAGAYMGEIFRAGIQAIPKGQMEAALALGLSRSPGSEEDHPAPDDPRDPPADRQRVHRASEGLLAGLGARGKRPAAARARVHHPDVPVVRDVHDRGADLSGHDVVLLEAGCYDGREDGQT